MISGSSDPSTASENACGDLLRRSACHTSSTIQTNAALLLRNWDPLLLQNTISKPACGRTTRDLRGRLVDAKADPMVADLVTATSMITTMTTTKSSYSSSRSAPARRWRPHKRSLQERAQLIIRGHTTQTCIRFMVQANSMNLMVVFVNALLQVITTCPLTRRRLLPR